MGCKSLDVTRYMPGMQKYVHGQRYLDIATPKVTTVTVYSKSVSNGCFDERTWTRAVVCWIAGSHPLLGHVSSFISPLCPLWMLGTV